MPLSRCWNRSKDWLDRGPWWTGGNGMEGWPEGTVDGMACDIKSWNFQIFSWQVWYCTQVVDVYNKETINLNLICFWLFLVTFFFPAKTICPTQNPQESTPESFSQFRLWSMMGLEGSRVRSFPFVGLRPIFRGKMWKTSREYPVNPCWVTLKRWGQIDVFGLGTYLVSCLSLRRGWLGWKQHAELEFHSFQATRL